MYRHLVLKFGGSYLAHRVHGAPELNIPAIRSMAGLCHSLLKSEDARKIVVVVGGGSVASHYISGVRQLNGNMSKQDRMGIHVSRLNALLFIEALLATNPDFPVYPTVPTALEQVSTMLGTSRVVVLGGLQPGQSTTGVAALCAELVDAELVVFATNVAGLHTTDPRKDKGATLIPKITYQALRGMMVQDGAVGSATPGQFQVMDHIALSILERSRIRSVICKGDANTIQGIVDQDSQCVGTWLYSALGTPGADLELAS